MGQEGAFGGTEQRHHRPGSRTSRLAAAAKQLDIVLEDVELEAEPELGEAVADAVAAVGRASHLVDDVEVQRPPARRMEWGVEAD